MHENLKGLRLYAEGAGDVEMPGEGKNGESGREHGLGIEGHTAKNKLEDSF